MKMQKYVAQPSDRIAGLYDVARWDVVKEEYIPIEYGISYGEACERAETLNKESEEENQENVQS